MTLVVSDNSPLDVLIRLGLVEVLPGLFDQVVLPTQVREELLSRGTPEITRQFIENPPPWLRTQAPESVADIPRLHLGERAAIALAEELSATVLLMDERVGSMEAKKRGLVVAGTIGVLERTAKSEVIDLAQTEQAFEKLGKSDFRIRPGFLDERLELLRDHFRQESQSEEAELETAHEQDEELDL